MTKKDGDKIREFQRELRQMEVDYARGSNTWEAARELDHACELALRGRYFEVHSRTPLAPLPLIARPA